MNPEELKTIRHSAEHVLTEALVNLYPKVKLAMGPATDEGFYADVDLGEIKVSEADFPKIEAEMARIIKKNLQFTKLVVSQDEAAKLIEGVAYLNNEYKNDWLSNIKDRKEPISFYKTGEEFMDLCAGPHVSYTPKIKAFKLLSVAGAYWHGDEKNKMLTRIYGTAFVTKEDLEKYLWQIDEAKKRDNRKIGKELELYHIDETAPGMPYWLPKGLIILNTLLDFWRKEHETRGYQEISSPLINKKELYVTSGHWDHYKDAMFIAETDDNSTWCLKPMNCPNAMIVFGLKSRSYKDLPYRLSDCDVLHRHEKSGTLQGLLRVQHITQDDAHIFVSEDQIEDEYNRILDIADRFYSVFGLEFTYRFGARPDKFMGDPAVWDKAEAALVKILDKRVGKGNYITGEKEGAFYGPKVDILMKDALGREWQMGTVQLDFQLPGRFNLKYADSDGLEKTPVVIHRVIYGSLERFIGIMIEHFAGAFPVWLSPVQVVVVPIADRHVEYAQKALETLKTAGFRTEVDDRSETMQARLRDAQMQKVPYMLMVGDKEAAAGADLTVSVRLRTGENVGQVPLSDFVAKIKDKVLTKALDLW